MKRILYTIMAMFIFLPSIVFAEGYVSASPSSLDMEVGSSKTFTITFYNAIGDVSISSSNSSVASISASEWGTGMVDEKQTKSTTITVNGVSVGSATITVSIDAATFDGEDLAGQTRQVTVNVREKTIVPPTNNNNNSNNNTNHNNNSNSNNNLSTNNKLKEISVEGYELVKVDENNYTLLVSNNVTNINVLATAEDDKATITGIGKKDLVVGENNFNIVVTSESGSTNKVNLKIMRKDSYYLEDLMIALNENKEEKVDITIKEDSKLSSNDLESIKKSKKQVNLNFYNEDKKLIYSWIIDGKLIKDTTDFLTTISFESKNKDAISSLSNYADGMYVNIHQQEELPKGIKLKLFVGEKYLNDNLINIYSYNNELKEIGNQIKVKDGYIEYQVKNSDEQFITMSNLNVKKDNNYREIFLIIISLIELVIIILLLIKNRMIKK